MPAKPSIVFVHGLWADGSCFSKVIPALQADGHQVLAAQHSLDSLEGDVATVTRALGRVSGPVLLVGHSYGGTVITAAGTDDRVAGLVYIAALAPDETETSQSQQDQFPVTDVFSYIEIADGRIWMLPEGIGCFAGDLSEQEQQLVWATQIVPDADLFNARGSTAPPGARSRAGTSSPTTTGPSSPTWSDSPPSGWAPTPTTWTAATSPCCPIPTSSSTSSGPPRTPSEPEGASACP